MDPELLPGSGIIVPDLDPAKYEKQIIKMLFLCEFWTAYNVGLADTWLFLLFV